MQWDSGIDLDRIRLAAELARHGVKAKPAISGNWLILGRSLICLGEWEQAATYLREAIAILPPSAELEMVLAEALLGQDLFEEALPHAEAALAMTPGGDRAKRLYFSVLALLRCWDKARLDMDSVDAFSPSLPLLMEMHVRSLRPADRLELCDRRLAADPAHTNAKYLKAVTLATLGRSEEARSLVALDRLVEITELATPEGYAGDESFRDSLAREIRANPTLARDPRSKAVRDGMRTRFLRQPNDVAIDRLLAQIRQAVDAYEQRLADSGHEFAAGRPRRARLQAWAVVYGAGGRQKAHRHPDGWLSGVYYVAAPRSSSDDAWRGRLIVGALDPEEHGVEPPWGTREIEPVPGRLVLFPSYVPHAAEPSGVEDARICVAFDVVPVRESTASRLASV